MLAELTTKLIRFADRGEIGFVPTVSPGEGNGFSQLFQKLKKW